MAKAIVTDDTSEGHLKEEVAAEQAWPVEPMFVQPQSDQCSRGLCTRWRCIETGADGRLPATLHFLEGDNSQVVKFEGTRGMSKTAADDAFGVGVFPTPFPLGVAFGLV